MQERRAMAFGVERFRIEAVKVVGVYSTDAFE